MSEPPTQKGVWEVSWQDGQMVSPRAPLYMEGLAALQRAPFGVMSSSAYHSATQQMRLEFPILSFGSLPNACDHS